MRKALTHDPYDPQAISLGRYARKCQLFAACAARWAEFFEAQAQARQAQYEQARRAHLLEQARLNRKKVRKDAGTRRPRSRKPSQATIEKLRRELTALGMAEEMINNLLAKEIRK